MSSTEQEILSQIRAELRRARSKEMRARLAAELAEVEARMGE